MLHLKFVKFKFKNKKNKAYSVKLKYVYTVLLYKFVNSALQVIKIKA